MSLFIAFLFSPAGLLILSALLFVVMVLWPISKPHRPRSRGHKDGKELFEWAKKQERDQHDENRE